MESNALSGTLLFNGRSLRNATTYNPNARANSGVVFSGTTLPANDTTGQITSLVTALKAAYSSTPDIASNANIANLIAATGSTAIQSLGTTIVSSQLGGSAVSGGGGGGGTVSTPCSPGSYSATGNNPCIQASAGSYVSNTGATTQIACTAGYFCTAGSTSAIQNQCPANKYCPA